MEQPRRPVDRILDSLAPDMFEALSNDLSGADLTSLLLETMRSRAAARSAFDVLRQYGGDRFVAPSKISLRTMRTTEGALLASVPASYDDVVLAPLLPLGAHSVVAPVDQNNVVSTVRGSEVAADPTAGLALEAADHRRELLRNDPRSTELVGLVSMQRVVRAQVFESDLSFAHFTIFGLVTAGRDTGNREFERVAAAEHAAIMARGLLAAGADSVKISVSDFGGGAAVADAVMSAFIGDEDVTVIRDDGRTRARGYYQTYAHRIEVDFGGDTFEVGDGGFVDWTQQYLSNRKERCLISGIGVDRVAIGAGR